MPGAVAIIPARGGSQRILGKNIKLFHGQPIIAYSIQAARRSGLFDTVYVSTDSPEIGKVAEHFGAEVIYRAPHYCQDHIGTQEVMQHHLTETLGGIASITYACCIYATAPMISVDDLVEAYSDISDYSLTANYYNYAFTVNASPLFDAGQFYFGIVQAFRNGWPLVGKYTDLIVVPPERVCDINTPEDWARAERMYAELHGIKL